MLILTFYQLHSLLRVLQNKLGVKKIEHEKMIQILSEDIVIPKFGEYDYYYETGTKSEPILFWVPNNISVF